MPSILHFLILNQLIFIYLRLFFKKYHEKIASNYCKYSNMI